MELVWPAQQYLPSYLDALRRGWSADNLRGVAAAQEEIERIAADADAFLSSMVDIEALGAPVTLPDGSQAPRLPGYRRWIWDGEFCGNIGLRWQPGTEALPSYCLGHIGYSIVPWKRGRGYATEALRLMLREATSTGMRYVEITTAHDNIASQRVILSNGGTFVEEFNLPESMGGGLDYRYRIPLVR